MHFHGNYGGRFKRIFYIITLQVKEPNPVQYKVKQFLKDIFGIQNTGSFKKMMILDRCSPFLVKLEVWHTIFAPVYIIASVIVIFTL